MRKIRPIAIVILIQLAIAGAIVLFVESELTRARGMQTQAAPHVISYQGLLTDSNGSPINGTRNLTLTVYSSNLDGVALWHETHTDVTVIKGAFSVLLGSKSALPDTLFDNPDRWLEIQVDGVVLTPRQRFTSVPYALNADKIDGYDVSELGGGTIVLPQGAVVWFRDGTAPAGYTQMNALGLDVGMWEPLTSRLEYYQLDDLRHNVWTGNEALCWERELRASSVGGRYDPVSDQWTPITTTGAPITRSEYSAIWTDSEMIIWGGQDSTGTYINTGARYNPLTDSWTLITTANAPISRTGHSAVWTGSEMVIWGGRAGGNRVNTGGLYNPLTDSWTPITTTNAPVSRSDHSAIWTGSEMIIWGGIFDVSGPQYPGGRYNPATNSWKAINMEGDPDWYAHSSTNLHTPLWTGSEMVVVPYYLRTHLYFYNPATDAWRWVIYKSIETPDDPKTISSVSQRAPVIAENLLVTYDGAYDLSQDKWVALAHEAVELYYTGSAVPPVIWTGDRILVLGGQRNLSHTIDLIYPYIKD